MGDTTIEWTRSPDGSLGKSWNPLRGCSRVSEGCMNCYAETIAKRFSGRGRPYEGLIAKGGQWNGEVSFVPEHLEDPMRWTKPRMVFVNSMSDLFHESVPFEQIAWIFGVMAVSDKHTFQVLTKRPQRMLDFFDWLGQHFTDDDGQEKANPVLTLMIYLQRSGMLSRSNELIPYLVSGDPGIIKWPLQNVWLGVSVENQDTAHERVPPLLKAPASIRFLSCEPLLGEVNLYLGGCDQKYYSYLDIGCWTALDWIIVGGESGKGARPMKIEWAESLLEQCQMAGTPFFMKQMGGSGRKSDWDPIPEHLNIREYPG